ncbi:MAG: hypothetical protein IKI63_02315 [Clostridia bacterium]|nr:hypothetical protein [Clostridia bacterium]
MQKTKRILCAAVAAIMLLFTAGCSTPEVAMSVGDRDYSTGEYLAYLYSTSNTIYGYYAQFSDVTAMWNQTWPYSNPYAREASDADEVSETSDAAAEEEQVSTAEYIRRATKDTILYMAAIEALMKENGITLSDEELADAKTHLAEHTDSDLRALGFSLDNYKKMYLATNYNEKALLHGLYGKGGKSEVPESELRTYFDENYLVYEIIQIALVDSEGNPLEADKEAEVRARIDKYMGVYQQTGDFDKAIEAYDNEGTSSDETSDVSDVSDVSEDAADETSDVSEEAVQVVSGPELNEDGSVKNVTTNRSVNVVEIDAQTADENLVKAIRSVDEGDVKIVEYKQDGKSDMLALLYRIDPDGTGRETYYDDSVDELLQKVKEDEFKALVWDKMDEQAPSVKVDQRAIDMCKPENFFN